MQRKKVLLLSCLLVVLLGGIAIVSILFLSGDSSDDKYRKKINTAKKYVQEENWDDAIVAYLEAIEYNDKDEDAYYTLAEIYIYKDMMDEAKELLEKGISLTDSQRLKDLYDEYFVKTSSDGQKDENKKIELNTNLLRQISDYSLNDYNKKYGTGVLDVDGLDYKMTHEKLSGVTFTYYDTEDNSSIIDDETDEPGENKMPCEVGFDSISLFISGAEDVISYEEFEKLSVKNLEIKTDNETGKNVVEFEASKCIITLECDDDGNVSIDAWNRVIPKDGNEEEEEGKKSEVEGTIVNAVTGLGVSNAIMSVWERGETFGDPILEVEADDDGKYNMEIEEGEYTAEIECDGFISENIDFEVDRWGEIDIEQFVISEEMATGEIRIVLEWGEYPRDLDSHLEGTTSDNRDIHIYYVHRDDEAANLDVDDTTSFGPETITVLDINGNYEYYVYDFTRSGYIGMSGATVKVYVGGESTPRVYEVPEDLEGDYWRIFSIENGVIKDN